MRKVKAGDQVTLRVYADGEYRTVRVTAGRAGDVYKEGNRRGFVFSFGESPETFIVPPIAPMAPMPPMVPMPSTPLIAPRAWGGEHFHLEMDHDEIRRSLEQALEGARRVRPQIRPRVQIDAPAAVRAGVKAASAALPAVELLPAVDLGDLGTSLDALGAIDAVEAVDVGSIIESALEGYEDDDIVSATASGDAYEMDLPGLRLAKVTADLAGYLGEGSERGLVVLEADSRWEGLRAGDVLLSVNGRAVRSGDDARLSVDLDAETTLEVLRRGEKRTIVLER
jgi:hypothetical protein